jgi:hypothetical protein
MTNVQQNQLPADQMVEAAVAYGAAKAFHGDTQRMLQALRRGGCDVCNYVRYSLARQIGDYLGQMDPMVKAVYMFDTEPVEFNEAAASPAAGISLIAQVERKTAALSSLVAALEADLSASRRKIGCAKATPACYFLDVHLVDGADVRERRGYGALMDGLFTRPVQVWARPA